MLYTMKSRIRYSEVDHHRNLKIPAMIDYFQDCATFHGEDVGNGLDALNKIQRAWIISGWDIKIYDMPKLYESVTIETALCGVRLFSPIRRHRILHEDGSVAAEGYSEWILLDVETGHPAKPEEVLHLYDKEEPLSFKGKGRHVRLPNDLSAQESFEVRRDQIDTNDHVNNSQYVRMAVSYLPKGFQTKRIRVEYKNAAVLGDTIYPYASQVENDFCVTLKNTDHHPYVNVCFEG